MTFSTARPIAAAALAAGLSAAAWQIPAHAAEDDFFSRFSGSWSGSGTVQRDLETRPAKVTCRMAGKGGAGSFAVSGTCRAMAVFSRDVGVQLRYDPASDSYRGTYTGSRIGPARLAGKRRGDALNLTITWPKPVNGDTKAQMTIQNAGNGRLSLVVTDKPGGTGAAVQTTSISLARR